MQALIFDLPHAKRWWIDQELRIGLENDLKIRIPNILFLFLIS